MHAFNIIGFASKEEYYDSCNPMRVVSNIKKPCIFINSEDDPLCVVENAYENLEFVKSSTWVALILTKCGSHLPFYDVFMSSWAEKLTFEFFESILASTS